MTGVLMLESLTRGNTLKQGDKTPLTYKLLDADGDNLNVAGKTAIARLVHPNYLTIGYEKTGLLVSQDDTVTFTIDNVIPARKYNVEIIVDNKFVFPSRSVESKFTIDKSTLGTEASIVEIIGVDAVVRKTVDLLNKEIGDGGIGIPGPQGPKGDIPITYSATPPVDTDIMWVDETEDTTQLAETTIKIEDKKPDEVDDTPRLKRALNEAKKFRGATINLVGDYYVSETLYFPAYLKLTGFGGATIHSNNIDMGVLVSVGYANVIDGIYFSVPEDYKGTVVQLSTKDILKSFDSTEQIFNHNYSQSQIKLDNVKIMMGRTSRPPLIATGLEILADGNEQSFGDYGGLYFSTFENITISGHFKYGVKIHQDDDTPDSWIHNMLFDNIMLKGCRTDVYMKEVGHYSYFKNIISQPILGNNEYLLELEGVRHIVFDNVCFWDLQYVENDKFVKLVDVRDIEFNACSFPEKYIDYEGVNIELLHTIEYNPLYDKNRNETQGKKYLIQTAKRRAVPYYDKIFTVRIPKSETDRRFAFVNFDITGEISVVETPYANITMYFELMAGSNEITIHESRTLLVILNQFTNFDREFLLANQRVDDDNVYADVILKTNKADTSYSTIKITNRAHQMFDPTRLRSTNWGMVTPHSVFEVEEPTSATPITFFNQDKNQIDGILIKEVETRIVDITTGDNKINGFLSGKGLDLVMADVSIRNVRSRIKENDWFMWDKSVGTNNDIVNVSINTSKDLNDVEITVTALATKKALV